MQLAGAGSAARFGARTWLLLGRAVEGLELLRQYNRALAQPAVGPDAGVVLAEAHLGRRVEVIATLDWLLTAEGALADRDLFDVVQYLEAAVLVRHQDAAATLFETLAPAADAATCGVSLTCAARHLAGAAGLLGKPDEARAYTQQALEVSSTIANRPEIALTRLQLAELLGDGLGHQAPDAGRGPRGTPPTPSAAAADDPRRIEAQEHLSFAISEFRDMKMQPSLDRAVEIQKRLLPSMNSPTDDSCK